MTNTRSNSKDIDVFGHMANSINTNRENEIASIEINKSIHEKDLLKKSSEIEDEAISKHKRNTCDI